MYGDKTVSQKYMQSSARVGHDLSVLKQAHVKCLKESRLTTRGG